MATTSTTVNQSDGWVLVDSSGADALIQCRSAGGELKVAFSTTAPAPESNDYHVLRGGEYIRRIGVDDVYVSTDHDNVVVTVSS